MEKGAKNSSDSYLPRQTEALALSHAWWKMEARKAEVRLQCSRVILNLNSLLRRTSVLPPGQSGPSCPVQMLWPESGEQASGQP